MPRLAPQFELVLDECTDTELTIRDTGMGLQPSVTNCAEDVVKYLVGGGLLPPGRRLMYYDSENCLDEILVKDGKFAGFRILHMGD